MHVSKRFLALLEQQLAQFTDRPDLLALVVYVAVPEPGGQPSLVAIGHWPQSLALSDRTGQDRTVSAETGRRWLRHDAAGCPTRGCRSLALAQQPE